MNFSNAFRVFKSRNYSLFFSGQLISRMGMWMQRTAVIWAIYQLTDSILMVGLATFAEQFPSFLLSPMGGIVADKYNRYKVLMVTQIASAIQAVLLTVVYYSGYGSLWVLLSLSLLLGIANAFDVPTRQSMVNDLVNNIQDLPSAIAMNSSLNNLTRLIGPAVAGIVIAKYGATICFGFNAVSFIAVIVCISLMKLPRQRSSIDRQKSVWTNLREGWEYMIEQPQLRNAILLAVLISLFVATYNTLQPYFAEDIFKGGASSYGYINAATGLGALVSTLFIASQSSGSALRKILFYNLLLLGVGLIIMSTVRVYPLYLVMCTICGFGVMSVVPICNTIVQTASSPEMRGRVMGFFAMATLGALPLGSVLIGWVTKVVSAETCQAIQGTLCLLIVLSFYKMYKTKHQKVN